MQKWSFVLRGLSIVLVVLGFGLSREPAAHADRPATARVTASARPALAGQALAQAVASLRAWVRQARGTLGLLALDGTTGTVLAGVNEHTPFNPASNAKLFTAAAALKRLGPSYRYSTELHGQLIDGKIQDLVLRGHGDPSFCVEHLSAMCRSLVAMGLKQVTGRILVDQSRFDSEYVPPAFSQQPDEWAAFRAPVSAVALERNAVTMNVVPSQPDRPATVWFHPPGFVRVVGNVQTGAPGTGQRIQWALRPDQSRLVATIGGRLATGLPRLRFERRVDDPRLFPGHVLRHVLQSMGVVVRGSVASGGQHLRARLVWHESQPLGELLGELGKHSDNFYAEMVLKTLGAELKGAPARSRDGAQVVADWLKEVGAADSSTVVANGSGLFDANRASAATLARALRAAYLDSSIQPEFVAQLAVGGIDGTLRSRFRRHARSRRVRGKTGTLAKVDALSGYLLGGSGQPPVVFSIIISGVTDHRQARRRIDRLVERLLLAR